MRIDGITIKGLRLNIDFGIHPSESLGEISMGQPSLLNMALYGNKEIKGYFTKEQLRKIKREVSRILFEVELKEKQRKRDEK